MAEFDDQPLQRAPEPEAFSTARPRSIRPLVWVAVAGLLAGGLAAWWWMRRDPSPRTPATATSDASIPANNQPARTLPPLDQMDTFLRALLGTLSSHPDFARWLATDDLIRQMASGIDRISRGYSPAATVPILRPHGDFEVRRQRGSVTIDPASFARYDRLASLVESLDARGVAEAYRLIQPRLAEAYSALGQTEAPVDDAVAVALQMLVDTPVPQAPIEVIPGKGATWAYRDPQLESLTPAQKQLLRMGPDNMRRVQDRLRAIRAELTKSESRAR